MKTVSATLLIFALLLGLGIFSYYYIVNTTNYLITHLDELDKNVQANEWPTAQQNYHELKSSWDSINAKWAIFLDHQELDNINISIARLTKHLETKNHLETIVELGELKLLLEHIPEKEALKIKNIF